MSWRRGRLQRSRDWLSSLGTRLRDGLAACRAAARSVAERISGQLRRRAVIARLQEADIVLASPRTLRLSPTALAYRLLLGARYVHSMLYLGRGRVLHTTSRHGVVIDQVPRTIYRRSRYVILRAQISEAQRRQVVLQALKRRHFKLDHAGLITNVPARLLGLDRPLLRMQRQRVWCSKLICDAYSASGVDLLPAQPAGNVTSEDLASSPLLDAI